MTIKTFLFDGEFWYKDKKMWKVLLDQTDVNVFHNLTHTYVDLHLESV